MNVGIIILRKIEDNIKNSNSVIYLSWDLKIKAGSPEVQITLNHQTFKLSCATFQFIG
jgi:hypothetical protein